MKKANDLTEAANHQMDTHGSIPRSPLLLSREQSVLLIIDAQTRLLDAIPQQKRLVWNLRRLVAAAEVLGIPRLATEQYPKGLGPTVAPLADSLAPIPEKLVFSAAGCSELVERLEQHAPRQVVLTGAETHVCVLQTALDLITAGYEIVLPVDATASRFELDYETALRRMETSGVSLVTTEGALFEWCQIAGTSEFKRISQLVKESPP
jgi:nicotinamidase-related amidase